VDRDLINLLSDIRGSGESDGLLSDEYSQLPKTRR
jgi:hypothetical protein